jgi:hypothetical protein
MIDSVAQLIAPISKAMTPETCNLIAPRMRNDHVCH